MALANIKGEGGHMCSGRKGRGMGGGGKGVSPVTAGA